MSKKIVKYTNAPIDVHKKTEIERRELINRAMSRKKHIDFESRSIEQKTEDMHNFALISLRKRFHETTKNRERLKNRIVHFNKVIKQKPVMDIVNILQILMKK